MKELEFKVTVEEIRALLEGKKLVYNFPETCITLYPDRYGVFMTYEKLADLRRQIGFPALLDTEGFFRELLGDNMYQVYKKEIAKKKKVTKESN